MKSQLLLSESHLSILQRLVSLQPVSRDELLDFVDTYHLYHDDDLLPFALDDELIDTILLHFSNDLLNGLLSQ